MVDLIGGGVLFCLVIYIIYLEWTSETNDQSVAEHGGSGSAKLNRWNELADRLGLEQVADYPSEHLRLEGEIRGESVTIRQTVEGGESVNVFEVAVEDVTPDGFAMTPQQTPELVDRLVEREDIFVGHEELDARYVFHGSEEREVKQFVWTKGVEEHLLAVRDLPPGTCLRDGTLQLKIKSIRTPEPPRSAGYARNLAAWVAELRELAEGRDGVGVEEERNREWVAPE